MIYKIFRNSEWEAVKRAGVFSGSPDDLRDGFIHFSSALQVRTTCDRHFSGEDNLVLAQVDPVGLEGLKWEPSRGGMEFPHLYGPLNLSAVRAVTPIRRGADGTLIFPSEIP